MGEETKETSTETKPALSQDAVAEITRQAVAAATQAIEGKTKEVLDNAERRSIETVTQRMIQALGGEANSEKVQTEVLRKWVNDPVSVLSAVQEHTRETVLREVDSRLEAKEEKARQENAKRGEFQAAATELFEKRPDIKGSKEAKELIDAYYLTTSDKLPEKERLESAMKKYDKLVESTSGKSAEDRVKEAASITTGSSKGNTSAPANKSKEEADREWLDERRERFKKISNGQVVIRS